MQITHGILPHSHRPSALTAGNFDGVHLGHQALLSQLVVEARQSGLESVAITFEPHPREWFGGDHVPARLSSLRDKLTVIRRCGIDHVHIIPFNAALANMRAVTFIEQLLVRGFCMHHLLIGDDFRFGAQRHGDFSLLQRMSITHGYQVSAMHSITDNTTRISSTAIREALATGQFEQAARWLGRPFSISGHVIHGDKRGRELGFPTANIGLNRHTLPVSGVFMVRVHGVTDHSMAGVANVGMRPTMKTTLQPRLEIHLLNANPSLYGRIIEVEFITKLRDEQKFADFTALARQITQDVATARDFFNLPLPNNDHD